ncbi:MAG: hypothetical protein D8M58_09325 [Calditrichaeota bacterium]|nr:MAG: hypothetical protein DWQ03_17165 [Calditrichota bacterium]MBL1205587.1 hypothetical protein [Calditrichota bacterium]NOG45416.1 hypothetical protein [Calditrichota bacterium]
MIKIFSVLTLMIFLFQFSFAQTEESPLRIFGYFQNSFVYEKTSRSQIRRSSFNMQQLNLIAQKDIAESWSAFINFQAVNNFTSVKQWGAFSVEEAWLRFRKGNHFNLKLGLQIPIFNSFNEIKNRTPLVPYVTKPLVYEDSYSEIIAISDFVPQKTFIQAYGFHRVGSIKIDYATYLGNSPNVETWEGNAISGLDTTDTFLFGTRLGFRTKNFKLGVSFTSDQAAGVKFSPKIFLEDSSINKLVHRMRLGADISFEFGNFDFKSEFIRVLYDENIPQLDLTKTFYYATLGYFITDEWYPYFSYWHIREKFLPNADFSFSVPTVGVSYMLNDRITLKAQSALIKFKTKVFTDQYHVGPTADFGNHALAVSVFF